MFPSEKWYHRSVFFKQLLSCEDTERIKVRGCKRLEDITMTAAGGDNDQ